MTEVKDMLVKDMLVSSAWSWTGNEIWTGKIRDR